MVVDWQCWWKNRKRVEFRRQIVPETWCSVGNCSVNLRCVVTGGLERVRMENDRVERVGWMVNSSRS